MNIHESTKRGARNRADDKKRIRAIRDAARDIQAHTVELEPDDDDKPIAITEALGVGDAAGKASELDGLGSANMPGARIVAVKLESGDWALDVLGNPWGGPNNGRDSDGEFFSPNTKFHEDKYPLPPAVYYHGFDAEGQPMGDPAYIGRTVERIVKPDGVWYRVLLDKASAYAKRVWEAALAGIARASSGSNHLHRVDRDGHIREWPVTELSIFDAAGKRQPANAYAVALPAMKAVYAAAGIPLPLDIEPEPEAPPTSDGQPEQNGRAAHRATDTKSISQENDMEPNEVQKLIAESVAAALKADKDAQAQAQATAQAEQERITEAVKAEREKWEQSQGPGNRLPGGSTAYVAKFAETWDYDNLDHADLAFMIDVLRDGQTRGLSKRGVSENAVKALAVRLADDTDPNYTPTRTAMKKAGMQLKANELMQSTLAGFGDEWVGVAYSTQLWERIRYESVIVNRIPTIVVPQGSESIILPLESTPPVFYKVAQAASQPSNPGNPTPTVPTSKIGTAQARLDVGKLGARVIYTGELEEDSMIPVATEIRRSLESEGAAVLEHVVIDGDTATGATTNINSIGGTPGGTEPYLIFDGFRKLALVTNTANSRDGGTLDILDYLATLQLLGVAGKNSLNLNAVSFIQDANTGWKTLGLAQVLTQDLHSQPTIENGILTRLWGREVITTENMHRANQDPATALKANVAGKVNLTTPANNVAGAILAVRFDQWRLGYKRRLTLETTRYPESDSTSIVALMRVGMVYRDTEAAAISYNIT